MRRQTVKGLQDRTQRQDRGSNVGCKDSRVLHAAVGGAQGSSPTSAVEPINRPSSDVEPLDRRCSGRSPISVEGVRTLTQIQSVLWVGAHVQSVVLTLTHVLSYF